VCIGAALLGNSPRAVNSRDPSEQKLVKKTMKWLIPGPPARILRFTPPACLLTSLRIERAYA
jgi:hypothetical protein